MTYFQNRPTMAAVDSDTLFKLLWRLIDHSNAFNQGLEDSVHKMLAQQYLSEFILEHPLEMFDLISRGRSSTAHWGYERTPEGPLELCYDPGDLYTLSVREVYQAPVNKFNVRASSALTHLMSSAEQSCLFRGHTMEWHLVRSTIKGDDVASGICSRCGKGVICRTQPALNSIDIGGEAVALGCIADNKEV